LLIYVQFTPVEHVESKFYLIPLTIRTLNNNTRTETAKKWKKSSKAN
jgi:hypothetical protein